MTLQHRVRLALLPAIALTALLATETAAQIPPGFITSFETAGPTEITYPAGYTTGSLVFQDNWVGTRTPRVQTAAEIQAELTAAGLNPAGAVRTGDQALLVAKVDNITESSGYIVYNEINGLETSKKVVVDFWARPLTSGIGADNLGTPGNNQTIGERQGNTFVGISDTTAGAGPRAAAVRFGIVHDGTPDPYNNVVTRTIDFASASAVTGAPWVPSGLTWEADQWYNFKFDLDYDTKKYDFFVNGLKVNSEPIRFYQETATAANYFFVSRGTNQAGQIIDDISVTEKTAIPGDFDLNGVVNGNDFLLWQRDTSVGSLADWKANFGAGASSVVATAVPEPTSALLVVSAVGGVIVASRRRRRTAA